VPAKSTEYKGANKFGDDDPVSRYGLPVGIIGIVGIVVGAVVTRKKQAKK